MQNHVSRFLKYNMYDNAHFLYLEKYNCMYYIKLSPHLTVKI